jgi:hypothetical protein
MDVELVGRRPAGSISETRMNIEFPHRTTSRYRDFKHFSQNFRIASDLDALLVIAQASMASATSPATEWSPTSRRQPRPGDPCVLVEPRLGNAFDSFLWRRTAPSRVCSKQIHLRRADERALGHELRLPPALQPLLVIARNPKLKSEQVGEGGL